MELRSDNFFGLLLGSCALLLLSGLAAYPVLRLKNAQWRFQFGTGKMLRTLHLYGGATFYALVLLHTGLRHPNDGLTGLLYCGVLLLLLTGGAWWWLQKIVPHRLAALNRNTGELEVLFERIPEAHAHVMERGEELQANAGQALRGFYAVTWLPLVREIKFSRDYFFTPPADGIARSVTAIKPLLRAEEWETLHELHWLYLRKQRLEASYSLQLVLKKFHLAHGPMAFVLLALALVHAFIR